MLNGAKALFTTDDCTDAGGRATQGAVAETRRARRKTIDSIYWKLRALRAFVV